MNLKALLYSVAIALQLCTMAQSDMIGYSLGKTLPQANLLNPAFLPDYRVSIGLPGLSGFHTHTGQNFTNLDVLTVTDTSQFVNTDDVFKQIKNNNRIVNGNTINLFHVGVRGLRSYSAFSVNTRTFARVTIPRDVFILAVEGNASENLDEGIVELNDMSGFAVGFTEVAISHGREFFDGKFTLGARLKYLVGHGVVNAPTLDAQLITYGSPTFRGDSVALINNGSEVRAAGAIGAALLDSESDLSSETLTSGRGFGLDLGATYQFSDRLSFSASLLDLGFINWNDEYAYQGEVTPASYTFSGVDFVDLVSGEETSFDSELDSAINDLEYIEGSGEGFATSLTSRFYAAATYQLTERQTASAVLYNEIYKGSFIPALAAIYNFQSGTFFNFSFSGTIMNGRINNLGTGITLNLLPFQLVLATNDLLSLANPMKARTADIRVGINHTFGKISRRKKNEEAKKLLTE